MFFTATSITNFITVVYMGDDKTTKNGEMAYLEVIYF
jgi:hypothetical protein